MVSVVMSVYNCEGYVAKAIDSILGQTFTDFEFIIINDGSTDNTLKVIKKYKDPRIVLISRENKGLVASLNEGIAKARGKYIARQDGDDLSAPTRLERQVEVMKASLSSVCGTFAKNIDEAGRYTRAYKAPYLSRDVSRRLFLGNSLVHGSVMFEKYRIKGPRYYSSKVGPAEDYALWANLPNDEVQIVPELLYSYRMNASGVSVTHATTQQESSGKIRDGMWANSCPPPLGLVSALRHARVYAVDTIILKQFLGDQKDLFKLALKKKRYLCSIQTLATYSIVRVYWSLHV